MTPSLPPNDAVGREIEIDALRPILGGSTDIRSKQNQESEESCDPLTRQRPIRPADFASFGSTEV